MKFSVSQTFPAVVRASIPDAEKPGVFRRVEFTARFRSQSNEPERRDELHRKQHEDGLYALLGEVMESVEFKQSGLEFEDLDGSPLEPIEWVKRNQFAGGAASLAFWDVINRDVEAKNSKR